MGPLQQGDDIYCNYCTTSWVENLSTNAGWWEWWEAAKVRINDIF